MCEYEIFLKNLQEADMNDEQTAALLRAFVELLFVFDKEQVVEILNPILETPRQADDGEDGKEE